MVERTLKRRKNFKSRNELLTRLPKQVMHQTVTTILRYLEESKKVAIKKDGSIVWIFADSSKIKKVTKKSKPSTRKPRR
jgi:hypothetical protein